VTDPAGSLLQRPRDVTALFRDALAVYGRNWSTLLAVSAAVVVPVQVVVTGIGLEQIGSSYDSSPSAAELVIPTLVGFLVSAPIITATCIYALQAVDRGRDPRAGEVLTAGFEAFAPIFFAILLAAAGIALGLLALIVPGVYLAVRWFFVPQAVVIERTRGVEALRRSGEAVRGFWWRVFGIVLLGNVVAALPGLVIGLPFQSLAESADRQVWALVGSIATEIVATPFVALLATLLYYDLRSRRLAGPSYRP
jgi:hypothetical protein